MKRKTGRVSTGVLTRKGRTMKVYTPTPPLINNAGKLVTTDEKAEILSRSRPPKWMDSRMGIGGAKSLSL